MYFTVKLKSIFSSSLVSTLTGSLTRGTSLELGLLCQVRVDNYVLRIMN